VLVDETVVISLSDITMSAHLADENGPLLFADFIRFADAIKKRGPVEEDTGSPDAATLSIMWACARLLKEDLRSKVRSRSAKLWLTSYPEAL
jgi:hypothetical protein